MQRFFHSLLALSCVTTIAACSDEVSRMSSESCPNGKRPHRATIRHIESGGIGYDEGYTTLQLFLSSDPSRWSVTPFLDARGHVFDNGKLAANAGVGLRALWNQRVYGVNFFYDYRNTSRLNYNQVAAGLETLGAFWDFRINGYLPVGKKVSHSYDSIFSRFSGHHMLIAPKYQFAMKGVDAEFGFHFGKSQNLDFYAAAGPYYFSEKLNRNLWGGKARIAGTFRDFLSLEISDSYDSTFHNKFQGKISFNFPFGSPSKIQKKGSVPTCELAGLLNSRMLQPVDRQEIIVVDKKRKDTIAIDPATGRPYFFVFVDNSGHSNGSFKDPYHTLLQAQTNSAPYDIIYVFPGDGTTTGMDSGITLQAYQKFWGSGISHVVQTQQGMISIPAQSSASPTITNTNIDTELNAITLAINNAISGFNITSALNDAIYGVDAGNLDVSFCTFTNTTTYSIQASSQNASISLTNNQFLNNANGISLTLDGTSTVTVSGNIFDSHTSPSDHPVAITANSGTLLANFINNVFSNNNIGSMEITIPNTTDVLLNIAYNRFIDNDTGSRASLGSNIVVSPQAMMTAGNCTVNLTGNLFSGNLGSGGNSLYIIDGTITNLQVVAQQNTMSHNAASGIAIATDSDTLTLQALNNTITNISDNAISTAGLITTAHVTITGNTITDILTGGSGINLTHYGAVSDLVITHNTIDNCDSSGIGCYPHMDEVTNLSATISYNTVSHCQNSGSNAASGLYLQQYGTFVGSIENNVFSDNTGTSVVVESDITNSYTCLHLSGNTNTTDYTFINLGDGRVFNLSPCDPTAVNTGTINLSESITSVHSCPDADPCSP